MSDYSPDAKIYSAENGLYSMYDLLGCFADPEMEVDGMPRISDLHMKVGEPVRFRCDGELETLQGAEALTEETIRALIFSLLQPLLYERLAMHSNEDLDASFYWAEQNINFRLNVFHDRDGIACVIRMLPKHIPEVDTLGFWGDELWQELVSLRQGLVLVTGATGNGKSTTIASLLDHINKTRKCRVITLEDPVEYIFHSEQALISQRELGENLKSFPAGLKSALRESPDVIFVGEIRDAETASLALTAAETGHLVFSTLHTKDTKGAIARLLDLFPNTSNLEVASLISHSLSHVIGQKLLRRKEGEGVVPAFEVLKNNTAVANMIRGLNLHQIYGKLETSRNHGMYTLEQHLLELVDEGKVTVEEAIAHANDSNFAQHFD